MPSICYCCSGENFDVEMKFGVDVMSLILKKWKSKTI